MPLIHPITIHSPTPSNEPRTRTIHLRICQPTPSNHEFIHPFTQLSIAHTSIYPYIQRHVHRISSTLPELSHRIKPYETQGGHSLGVRNKNTVTVAWVAISCHRGEGCRNQPTSPRLADSCLRRLKLRMSNVQQPSFVMS
jgi:hypothetical protein